MEKDAVGDLSRSACKRAVHQAGARFCFIRQQLLLYIELSNVFSDWPKAYSEFSKLAPVTL